MSITRGNKQYITFEIKKVLKQLADEVADLQSKIKDSSSSVQQSVSNIRLIIKDITKSIVSLDRENKNLKNTLGEKELEIISKEHEYNNKLSDFFSEDFNVYIVGYNFEKHVVWWMKKYYPHYDLKIWQGDKCVYPYKGEQMIFASWNQYPDLIFADEGNKKVLALECKYTQKDTLSISCNQLEHYRSFEQRINRLLNVDAKVYIMVGSGTPDSRNPISMYCIPISYFDNMIESLTICEIKLRDIPEYRVMRRDPFYDEIQNFIENIPFK